GVMNIMLVTVTERTREIGIRKALGAQRSDIITQFLSEAMLLASLGGVIGVVLGVGIGHLKSATMQPVVSPGSVVMAFGVSVLIGIFFGAYPASRAAALTPMEALRYESSRPLPIPETTMEATHTEAQGSGAARSFDLDAMGLGPPTKVRRRGKIDKWTRILGVAVVLLLVFNIGVRMGHA